MELASRTRSKHSCLTVAAYVGDPAKDVCVEADVILTDVESALDENLLLQGTTVI